MKVSVGNVGWNAVGLLSMTVLNTFTAVIVARGLGVYEYGRLAFWLWVAETTGQLGTFGLARPLARFATRAGGSVEGGLGIWPVIRPLALRGTVAAGALALAIATIASGDALVGVAVGLHAVAVAATGSAVAVLQGFAKFRRAAVVAMATSVVLVAGSLVVVSITPAARAQVCAVAGSATVGAALAVTGVVAFLRPISMPSRDVWGEFKHYWAAAAALMGIELVVWGRSEVFFLSQFSSPEQVGLYTAAVSMSSRLTTIAPILAPVLLTHMTGLDRDRDVAGMQTLYRRGTEWAALAAFPVFVIGAATADRVIAVVFGAAYAAAGVPLQILLLGAVLPVLSVAGSAVIYGGNSIGFALRSGSIAAIVTVLLDATLIPLFAARGAAVANVTGQTFAVAVTYALHLRRQSYMVPWRALLELAFASVCGAAVARALVLIVPGALGLGVALTAGLCAYVLVTWGVWSSKTRGNSGGSGTAEDVGMSDPNA